MQVTGYEDGSQRPVRPKYDAAFNNTFSSYSTTSDCDDCIDIPCNECPGELPQVISHFVSSEGKWDFNNNVTGNIYALRLIVGDHQYIVASEGHIKLDADLNRGAGGKYIYLTFTRNPIYSYENDGYHDPITYNEPLTDLYVEAHTQFGVINDGAPYSYLWRHIYRFDGIRSIYPIDLNEGAGGRYIFAYVTRSANGGVTPIKEVGILYGNSSTIEPPSGWIKEGRDLNQGAGGDYIYICYKR